MHHHNELVSIGIPVYNGERFIERAIASVLIQDYSNIEVIICDNVSQDNTYSICERIAKQDKRIRLYRNEENVGAANNFNKVFQLSKGDYFCWLAHDDIFSVNFISSTYELLKKYPMAGLGISDIVFIDENDQVLDVQHSNRVTYGKTNEQIVYEFINGGGWFELYGLFRRQALEDTKLFRDCYGGDVLLLLELALQWDIVKVPEKLFLYRYDSINKSAQEMHKTTVNPQNDTNTKQLTTHFLRNILQVIKATIEDDKKAGMLCDVVLKSVAFDNPYIRNQIIAENEILTNNLANPCKIVIDIQQVLQMKTEKTLCFEDKLNTMLMERPIFVWGAGAGLDHLLYSLSRSGIMVNGVVDIDPKKQAMKSIYNLAIYPPEYLNQQNTQNKPYVYISSTAGKAISEQLEDWGFKRFTDYF